MKYIVVNGGMRRPLIHIGTISQITANRSSGVISGVGKGIIGMVHWLEGGIGCAIQLT